jgi:hypothetical protein
MLRNYHHQGLVLFGVLLALAACAPSTTDQAANKARTQIAATNTVVAAAFATSLATATPWPTPTVIPPIATTPSTALPLPGDQDLAQLKAQVLKQLTNNQQGSPDQPLDVSVLPLTTTGALSPLVAAYSTGSILSLLPDGRHVLALYTFAKGRWEEVQQLNLETSDYMSAGSVQQVPLEPTHIWLEVQSGAGAHSGCYDLFAFDPISRSVSHHIASCNSSPGAGYTADVNGDSQLDVVLDGTDYYVFCYACGVTKPQYSVLAWDGKQLSEVTLSALFDATPSEAQPINNAAVQLARAGLWKDAQAMIGQAKTLKADNRIVRWNAALIDLHAQAYRDQVDAQSFPLLNNIFYGDYAAALNVLRAYAPDQIFSPSGPVIIGTVADGWIDQLAKSVSDAANAALQVKPDLAAAYFLRGWVTYLQNPGSPQALDDIERAAQLDPAEPVYAQSVVYLKQLP